MLIKVKIPPTAGKILPIFTNIQADVRLNDVLLSVEFKDFIRWCKSKGVSDFPFHRWQYVWRAWMENIEGDGRRITNDNRDYYRKVYLKTDHWKELRSAFFSTPRHCVKCGKSPVDPHHRRYKSLYDVGVEDLVALCRNCHDLLHAEVPTELKGWLREQCTDFLLRQWTGLDSEPEKEARWVNPRKIVSLKDRLKSEGVEVISVDRVSPCKREKKPKQIQNPPGTANLRRRLAMTDAMWIYNKKREYLRKELDGRLCVLPSFRLRLLPLRCISSQSAEI